MSDLEYIADDLLKLIEEVKEIIKDMEENGDGANFYRGESLGTVMKIKRLLTEVV